MCIDEMLIILKCVLKEWGIKVWIGFMWLVRTSDGLS